MVPGKVSPFVIFLDIDGVINPFNQEDIIESKMKELFPGEKVSYEQALTAQAHCFSLSALANLDHLIREIQKTHPLQIVISSSWRMYRSVEELKSQFGMHSFSQFISGKTPDYALVSENSCKGQHDNTSCRATEITQWLKEHPEVLNYAVLDDYDDHLSLNFEHRYVFIKDKYLLTMEHANSILKRVISP